ncbi:PREDICTED: checkpoint protein HUS1 [Nicrophorus vespilloides]|uniref:Checkpoint protein n=1 Tax=Nicrophorus vespilloides TaxID=110193 RepID=A0ABM1NEM3_NICVS|nr:PREDICTED: checkpoint protein HUS1 [Nicrophorus vespilloides]
MKFRGVMIDDYAMKEFMNISNSLSKLSKECVMRLTARKVYFIISTDDAGPKKPFVWCELPMSYYFKDFTFNGESEEFNEIYISFGTAMLAKSLMTLKYNGKSLKLKLTNKQTPCLTVDIEQKSENILSRQCVHDIPVDVITSDEWGDYSEPSYNDFHVSIQLPNLKTIKNIVERMKNISTNLIVSATESGKLILKVKTPMVSLSANFPNLSVESFAVGHIPTLSEMHNQNDTNNEDCQAVSAVIDVKKFLMFLTGLHISNCRTICSIVHGQMVKLHLEQPGVSSLQCFLSEITI